MAWHGPQMATDAKVTFCNLLGLKLSGLHLHLLTKPSNIRLTSTTECQRMDNIPVPVPLRATAILATITTFSNARSDFVVHSFGRSSNHTCAVADNAVFEGDAYLNDVLLTSQGECSYPLCSTAYYGTSHGTVIIPVTNATMDATLTMGYSWGTHYITVLVVGYFVGPYFLAPDAVHNIRLNATGGQINVSFVDSAVPHGSSALIATVTSFLSGSSDKAIFAFGPTASHASYDFAAYNAYYGDAAPLGAVLLSHEGGDVYGDATYPHGNSYGSTLLPLVDGTLVVSSLGAASDVFLTAQVFGVVPAADYTNIRFFSESDVSKLRITFTSPNFELLDIHPNATVPSGAIAILCNVFTASTQDVSDHMVHSFGRFSGHDGYVWDNRVSEFFLFCFVLQLSNC
jgi:hypothetical protein